jgi:hypothetical protein
MGMAKEREETKAGQEMAEMRRMVQEAIAEYAREVAEQREPALKVELGEERRRREQLERRLNEVAEENSRHRKVAEEGERFAAIKSELEKLGVRKVELAFRAVRDEVVRGEDGRLYGRSEEGEVGLREYLERFIAENPELLPARIAGGSGASGGNRGEADEGSGSMELSRIRPGMSGEERERARREIARLAGKDYGKWV